MMVIGSTAKDIMAVNIPPSAKALKEETTATGIKTVQVPRNIQT
jgi:hypothetical protein